MWTAPFWVVAVAWEAAVAWVEGRAWVEGLVGAFRGAGQVECTHWCPPVFPRSWSWRWRWGRPGGWPPPPPPPHAAPLPLGGAQWMGGRPRVVWARVVWCGLRAPFAGREVGATWAWEIRWRGNWRLPRTPPPFPNPELPSVPSSITARCAWLYAWPVCMCVSAVLCEAHTSSPGVRPPPSNTSLRLAS